MAAEWTQQDVAALVAPEMEQTRVAPFVFDEVAALVDEQLAEGVFPRGTRARKWAGMYLTAHLLTVCPPPGVTPKGPVVSSESGGAVSVSYAVPQFKASDLVLSPYGLQFQRLTRARTCGGLAT